MRKAFYYIIGMTAALLTACTNDIGDNILPTDVLTLDVAAFPAFGNEPGTRAINTTDPGGKTAWQSGDRLLVSVTGGDGSVQTATMTYDGSAWITQPVLRQTSSTYAVTAYYAPAYEWGADGNTLALMSGKAAGTDEFLRVETANSTRIDFSTTQRTYSRLRFVSSTNTPLEITLSGFTPAGDDTSQSDYTATLTTDSKGNAYLYGSWNANAKLTVSADYLTSKIEKTLSASTPAQSYALDTPQLISSIPSNWNNSTTDITGYYKLNADITLPGNWTPIGNATTNRQQGRFIGTFDGGGHQIKGLKSESSGDDFGLFRVLGTGGVIKNVNLTECSIDGSGSFVAGIVATNHGTIENCHVIGGTIKGKEYVGGLVSYNNHGSVIVACSNSADISGNQDIGGLFSRTYDGTTTLSCFNAGNVTGNSGVGEIAGGIGILGTVTTCYYLDGNSVKRTDGVETTWDAAISDMNSALQAAGYSYQYELDTSSGLPVVKTTE